MKKLSIYKCFKQEKGNVLVMVAVFSLCIMGAAALVTDVGTLAITKARMQNAADAAALAGVAYLPDDPASARTVAQFYGASNNIAIDSSYISVASTFVSNDTIVVQPLRTVLFGFARVLGINSGQLTVQAKAIAGSMGGGTGAMPWGLKDTNPNLQTFGRGYGVSLPIRLYNGGAWDFQALAVDGTGGSDYRDAIEDGSRTNVQVGSVFQAKTGAMDGPTAQGIETRIAGNSDTFSQVVETIGVDTFKVKKWGSPRLVIIPVVTGGDPYTVKAFTLFFIESCNVQGNVLDVVGRFINTPILGKAFSGYVGNYGLRVTKLTN